MVKIADIIDMENLITIMPGYIYWLGRDNIYQGCNERCARSFGLASRYEVVGLTNYDFLTVSRAMADVWNQNNLEVMESGIAKLVEEPSLLGSGELVTMVANKVPLFDKENNVIGLLGVSLIIPEK